MKRGSAHRDMTTGVYGVVGRDIGYTQSPAIFRHVFSTLGWSADYTTFDISKNELRPLLEAMRRAPLRGLNITKPYKVAVIPLLDRIDETAASVGAVNTVVCDGRKLVGHNTDANGVMTALRPFRSQLRGRGAVIFGAGGAARAVAHTLLDAFGVRHLTIAARIPSRARKLLHEMQDRLSPATVASAAFQPATDLREALHNAAIVVNATPMGTPGTGYVSPFPQRLTIRNDTVAFDLVYRPRPTRFLRDARRAGFRHTIDGWPMLIAQAEASFRLWTGRGFTPAIRSQLLMSDTRK